METLWFALIALMLAAYVVLDGFDLGAGAISWFIGRTAAERKTILSAVGPVWDGNEVWLIAAGGALFFAFPALYASAFSGFYLPLMMVLWLLMLRGMGIELRSHVQDPLWWTFFDFLFFGSSALLAVFFGAAIGNVLRGVPLQADGYFFEALWTNFRVGPNPGILDWYTVLIGLLALAALSMHGALFVIWKTGGALAARARHVVLRLWPAVVVLTAAGLYGTMEARPSALDNFHRHVWAWTIPALVAGSLISIRVFTGRQAERASFLCSAAYLVAMLGGAAFAMYPTLLPAVTNPAYSLTIYNSHTGAYSMRVGLVWWLAGMILATVYFVFLYTSFRGKVGDSNH